MKLHIIQSLKGDCMVLETKDRRLLLVDGGMGAAMRDYGRKAIAEIADGRPIEAAYVSHIDQDHIAGVLMLLRDTLAWRVYDYRSQNGVKTEKPDFPRPPEIKGVWHNTFRDQIGSNSGAVEDLLAAAAPAFLATGVAEIVDSGSAMQEIAFSIPEALEVSKLASADLLDIPVNKLPGKRSPAKLLMRRAKQKPIKFGQAMTLTILGPGEAELENLRDGWNEWLRNNREKITQLRRKIRDNIDNLGAANLRDGVFGLRGWYGIEDYKGVTTPNIASLMFMAEEDGKRILLTGDSQQDFILDGLEKLGYLVNGRCHVDVLKVQHHGSEHNIDPDFCRKISADHYVFCGNGEHGNPELQVLKMIFDSRLGAKKLRALAPEAQDRAFTFWFSTTSDHQNKDSDERENFEAVEAFVDGLIKKSNGFLSANFNQESYMTLRT